MSLEKETAPGWGVIGALWSLDLLLKGSGESEWGKQKKTELRNK